MTQRRIPNLFHLMLFLALTFASLLVTEAALLLLHPHAILQTLENQRLQLFANIFCYALTFAAAAFIFPKIWQTSFWSGISWNWHLAKWTYIPAGLILGAISQAVSTQLPIPKKLPIEKMFEVPGVIWVLVVFGIFIAPIFEEVVFRGLLLPGIAILIDYVRLPKSLEALEAWRASTSFSRISLVISSLITSLCFAGIHAPQLGFSLPAVALLIAVSLILCVIRLRANAVAASTLVHASYNFSVFLTLFIGTSGFRHMDKL